MKHVLVYGMTDNPGGIETYLLNFFQRVQGKTVMLDFVSDFPAISGCEILEKGGAELHFIPAKSKDLKGHLLGMWRILRQHREYETVYFNILDAGAAITMLPVFLAGRKIVVHSHNGSTDKVKLHKICKPLLNMLCAEKAACSDAAAEHMFGRRGSPVLSVPNVIDSRKYTFSETIRTIRRRELGLEERPVIVHVGRISMQKNPYVLLDIFEKIHARCPEAVLLSIGDGELMADFTAYIQKKGLQDSVRCLGVRTDVPDILQAADVFLFPSLYEGMPISLLEAQAAGLPCVISDTISDQTIVTDLVCRLSLDTAPEIWAERVLERLHLPRRDTYLDLKNAGFDISNCQALDNELIGKF